MKASMCRSRHRFWKAFNADQVPGLKLLLQIKFKKIYFCYNLSVNEVKISKPNLQTLVSINRLNGFSSLISSVLAMHLFHLDPILKSQKISFNNIHLFYFLQMQYRQRVASLKRQLIHSRLFAHTLFLYSSEV